jgi:Rha family phage regulatory protein
MDNLKGLNNEVTMTSLDVAELTGKRHSNVIRDIRNEIEQLEKAGIFTEHIFVLSEYKDSTGRKLPMYTFGMEGTMQLGMRYSAETRNKMIQYIKKVELEKQQGFKLPGNYKEALLQLVEQVEVNELLIKTNKELKPKAEQFDIFEKLTGYLDFKESAKILSNDFAIDIGRTRLTAFLRERGILLNNNEPRQKYVEKGYFVVKTCKKLGVVYTITLVTPKGLSFIYKQIKKYYN